MSAEPDEQRRAARKRGVRPRRALLLVNPRSNRGGAALDPVLQRLRRRGLEIHRADTASREDAREQILRHAEEVDLVIVGGGDGALNAAASALHETGLPLGVLPLGTANDLARTLGIPTDLKMAADIIAAGETRRIDLGMANGEAFFNVASLGLSTELAQALSPGAKQRLGRFSYMAAAILTLLRARPFRALIRSEDEAVRVKTYQIAVGSGRYYGGGVPVVDDAKIDDGHLDLYSLEVGGAWQLALMAPWFRRGVHTAWREVRADRGKAFEVRTTQPRPVNLDGELVTFTPVTFRVLRDAIQVYAPKPSK
ncbi:lipid kinase [Phenylobacterium sp.]|jgi:YegS/Rv2252/BmrU family lipid kinase|uniref:lipid kinase n=1 Tax=Phenylobacterium sp. TaxID=1871053 RepID=UPI002E32BE5B|nr:lipid kinase [Phenylobacterium sp.]HEX2559138.1 lipid kinase [Phenylobacterium sp.]